MKQWGLYLIVIGLGSFVLPLLGLQFGLINIFGEENQTLAALGITGLGAILYVVGSIQERVAPGREVRTSVASPQQERFAPSPTVAPEATAGAAAGRCAECGASSHAGDRFCRECGAQVAEPGCPTCGTPARPGDRFCRDCGAQLAGN